MTAVNGPTRKFGFTAASSASGATASASTAKREISVWWGTRVAIAAAKTTPPSVPTKYSIVALSEPPRLIWVTTTAAIQINGDNPAVVNVGATYNDLGATITGPQQDLNLGITTYLNETLTSDIVIDTSQAATDTIDYVATDQNGLTATSTRTVFIEPTASSAASTTIESTSTVQ